MSSSPNRSPRVPYPIDPEDVPFAGLYYQLTPAGRAYVRAVVLALAALQGLVLHSAMPTETTAPHVQWPASPLQLVVGGRRGRPEPSVREVPPVPEHLA